MPPPSQLTIATSSLLRLLKEETSYHTEQASQEARLDKLQQLNTTEDENIEYEIRQQKRAIEETKALFPGLRSRIEDAGRTLEGLLLGGKYDEEEEEVRRAKDALVKAKERAEGGS